jgi:uncharacterized protein
MTPDSLAMTVVVSSLLGSVHCVGMCGPFVLIATSRAAAGRPRRQAEWAYHAGRLSTYFTLGTAAAAGGSLLNLVGAQSGSSHLAAWLAGSVLLAAGLIAIGHLLGLRWPHPPLPAAFTLRLQQAFRATGHWPVPMRAAAIGMLTTWIPCGWLYAFVIVAAGAGSWLGAMLIMTAFWLGSLPLMHLARSGVELLAPRVRRLVPWVTAGLLVATGLQTLVVRANADFSSINAVVQGEIGLEDKLKAATSTPLPCCQSARHMISAEQPEDHLSSSTSSDSIESATTSMPPCCTGSHGGQQHLAEPGTCANSSGRPGHEVCPRSQDAGSSSADCPPDIFLSIPVAHPATNTVTHPVTHPLADFVVDPTAKPGDFSGDGGRVTRQPDALQ